MCLVSFVGDTYTERWRQPGTPWPNLVEGLPVSRAEFEELKREMEQVKELLLLAKIRDQQNGEEDCEMEAKVELIKLVAEKLGVDLEDVFS